MTRRSILPAWEFPRGATMIEMVSVAREATPVARRELDPDLELVLLSSTGDTITVQVVKGTVPVDPDALVYVRGRGAYEVLQSEPRADQRQQLTLAAWPSMRTYWH